MGKAWHPKAWEGNDLVVLSFSCSPRATEAIETVAIVNVNENRWQKPLKGHLLQRKLCPNALETADSRELSIGILKPQPKLLLSILRM